MGINDYNIIPLASKKELDEEGKEMKNCVGWSNYDRRSLKGHCKIYTIRDKNYNRVATMSIVLHSDKKTLFIEELYGYDNSNVSCDVDEACVYFTKYLKKYLTQNSNKMKQILEEIHNPPKEDNSIPSMCGYLPDSKEKVLEAMKHWNEFLPREYRNNLDWLIELL